MRNADFLLLYRRRFRGAPRVETTPVNFVAPVVSGDLDGILTCSTGSWSQMWSQTFTYQWHDASDDSELVGETGNTLDSQNHIGLEVYCVVTATNSADSASEPSNTVGPLEEFVAPEGAPTANFSIATNSQLVAVLLAEF